MAETTSKLMFQTLLETFFSKAWDKLTDYGIQRVKKMNDYQTNLETLETNLKLLSAKNSDFEEQIKNGELSGKRKRKREVDNWLEGVKKIKNELVGLRKEVEHPGFINKFLGNKDQAEKLDARICKCIDNSQLFGELFLDTCETRGVSLPTSLVTGKAFEKNMEKIWKWLVIDKVPNIGIYGMGGVGKTTLAKHLNNKLLKETSCSVYWVSVAQVSAINKLQDDIAKVIGLDLSDEDNEEKRAGKLKQALSQRKDFVLILDNVWDAISLVKLGDPLGVEGCRLIVTTRSLSVCRRIGCKEIIEVETLGTDESWHLFKEIIWERSEVTSEVKEIAKSVAKECDGLPLGIVILATRMKGVTDVHEWRCICKELRESSVEQDFMINEVFQVLKYSFNGLDTNSHERGRRNGYTKLQCCFLYCSLYPKGHRIDCAELFRKFDSEELVDRRNSREEQQDLFQTMLNTLVNLSLLQTVKSESGELSIKMHNLVRNMALKIARESPKYKVFVGRGLKEIPNEEEWTEDVDKMSLMYNDIEEIPEGMTPKCLRLETLLLNGNPLKFIPESFFLQMSGLRILDLSRTLIKELPNSLLDLESLNMLLLRECKHLASVPDLGKLKALRELDLSKTSITSLPKFSSDLKNLYRLSLRDCHNLASVPDLGKLEALRELDLSRTSIKNIPRGMENLNHLEILLFRGTMDLNLPPEDLSRLSPDLQQLELPPRTEVPIHEIERFKQLKKFAGRFKNVSNFNQFIKFQSETGFISTFHYETRSMIDVEINYTLLRNTITMLGCSFRREEGEHCVIILPEKIKKLKIVKCEGLSSCLLDDLKLPSLLEELEISDCEGVQSILSMEYYRSMAETAINVQSDSLNGLQNFNSLINWKPGTAPPPSLQPQAAMAFSSLTYLHLSKCNKMKNLGLPILYLRNLERIHVYYCDEIEEIIEGADYGHESCGAIPFLPNLKNLQLQYLPKLKTICKGIMDCNSIECVGINECPKVELQPLFLPPSCASTLKEVYIQKEWWESLEWRDPTHKHMLQPVLKYYSS